MNLIITDAWLYKGRTVYLSGSKVAALFLAVVISCVILSVGLFSWVTPSGVLPFWTVGSGLARSGMPEASRERFLRENLDVLARRLGEMQAQVLQLEALGERISGLAGINPKEVKPSPGRGGALVGARPVTVEELQATLSELEKLTSQKVDLMTVIESRLLDQKVRKMMVPTQSPVAGVLAGSPFGWRIDPLTGRSALHTGLDFPADTGTPIVAAAGGVVVTQEFHPAYGNMLEISHDNGFITRYAHASRVLVKKGDLVKRGHKVAEVGSTGRSTGPHLHFELLVQGVMQNPQKFLDAGQSPLALNKLITSTP